MLGKYFFVEIRKEMDRKNVNLVVELRNAQILTLETARKLEELEVSPERFLFEKSSKYKNSFGAESSKGECK